MSEQAQYEGELSFEQAMAAAMQQEVAAEQTEEQVETAEVQPGEEAASAEEAVSTEEAKPAEETDVQADDRSLQRLMQREIALEKRKADLEAQAQELNELRGKVKDFEYWQEDFKSDPVGFLKASFGDDVNLAAIAEDFWLESQGEKAPSSYRAVREARAARSEARKARREMKSTQDRPAEEPEADEGASIQAKYVSQLEDYASSKASEKYPLVAKLAKRDIQRVKDAMFSHAIAVAQQTGGNRVLEPHEAAALLEKELQLYQLGDDVESGAQSKTQPETKEASEAQTTTLRNSHSQVQPDRVPVDPNDDFHLRKQAFLAMGKTDAEADKLARSMD